MAGIFKNQILKHLSRFAKNLSPDKLQLSALKGHGELHNLELNELVLTEVLELPSWLRISRANCNHVTIKIHWTKLKTHPISLFLDELLVETETCEDLRPLNLSNNSSIYSNTARKYGFSERVIDGMLIHINSVIINFVSPAFKASLMLSRLTIESRTPSWKRGDLRLCRIKDQEKGLILLFKQIDWQVLRIEAKSCEGGVLTPLRLITNQATCRITIKKRLSDSSLIDWKIFLVLDDLLWVLTDSQLLAAIHFSSTLSELIKKSTQLSQKLKAKHKLEQQAEAQASKTTPAKLTNPSLSTLGKVFNHYDVNETSYHVLCNRIDLHLCDELNPKEGRSSYEGLQKGGAFLISLKKLTIDYYPYHRAFSSRERWMKYTEPSSSRSAWIQQLLSQFHDQLVPRDSSPSQKHVTVHRAPPHAEEDSTGAVPRRSSLGLQQKKNYLKYLMSSCIVIRLDEYTVFKVSTAASSRKQSQEKFVYSDRVSLLLPADTKSFHIEFTSYYFPGDLDYLVPSPNIYAHFGPLVINYDTPTILWLNTFQLNLQSSLKKLLANSQSPSLSKIPLDMKVEALMPQIVFHADSSQPTHPDRPKSMRLQVSRLVATNCRIGEHASRLHLNQCLDTLSYGKVFFDKTSFPRKSCDFNTVSEKFVQHMLGKDNNDLVSGLHIWSIHLDPCWVEFNGCEPSRSRPQTFVEPLPITLWLNINENIPLFSETEPDISILAHFHSLVNVQITRYQYLFLLRLTDSLAQMGDYMSKDTRTILKADSSLTYSISGWFPQIDVSLILRSLNQLSATSDSMEPLSLQDDGSSNDGDCHKKLGISTQSSSFSLGDIDFNNPNPMKGSSDMYQANGVAVQDITVESPAYLPQTSSIDQRPQDTVQKGFQSATSAMKKGFFQFMPSMDSILAKDSDTSLTEDDTLSIRSDFSSDSDPFVIMGLESSLVDDDFFNNSSPAPFPDIEVASEIKEDTFSNCTNMSERRRELISVLVFKLCNIDFVMQAKSDVTTAILYFNELSCNEIPSISWENFQHSFNTKCKSWPGIAENKTPKSDSCVKLRMNIVPKFCNQSNGSKLEVHVSKVSLMLLKSSMAGLIEFVEDEIIPEVYAAQFFLKKISLTITEDKNLNSTLPIDIQLPSCLIERSDSGSITFLPYPQETPEQNVPKDKGNGEDPSLSLSDSSSDEDSLSEINYSLKRELNTLKIENQGLSRELGLLRSIKGDLQTKEELREAKANIDRLEEEKQVLLRTLTAFQLDAARVENGNEAT